MIPNQKQLKLQTLLDKSDQGDLVTMRDLKSVLGKEGVEEFERRWKDEKINRESNAVPDELRPYIKLLQKACFFHNRAEGRAVGKVRRTMVERNKSASRFASRAEQYCQDALDYLEPCLDENRYLEYWIDRSAIFDGDDAILPDIESMPRLITSKSALNENRWPIYTPSTKRQVKRRLIQDTIDDIDEQLRPHDDTDKLIVAAQLANVMQLLRKVNGRECRR